GDPTGGWLVPRCSSDDRAAYERGKHIAEVLIEAGMRADAAVILDLPGPHAVAAAAGMSVCFDPVFTFDNLPHPSGVVASAQTLGAVVYWRPQLAWKTNRSPSAPALFVLEGDRLAPYRNQVDVFDNRSVAKLPSVAGFRELGVSHVLYIKEQRGNVGEADDL